MLFTDIILLFLSFIIIKNFLPKEQVLDSTSIISLVLLWIAISLKYNLLDIPRVIYIDKIISKNLHAILVFTLLSTTVIYFIFKLNFQRTYFVFTILLFAMFLIIWRLLLLKYVKKYRELGYNFKTIVFVGYNINIQMVIDKIEFNPDYGYKIRGLFTDADLLDTQYTYYKGKLKDVKFFCKNNNIDDLIISLPHYKNSIINELLQFGENNVIRVTIMPENTEYLSQVFSIEYFDGLPLMKLRKEPLEKLSNKIIKRIFDIVFSWLVIIFIFTWLFPIIAIVIKLTSKGPVFFVQMRSGKNDNPFKCYKFRTMKLNEACDNIQAVKGDSRITPIGKFLRRTSLDELPQFFNVIKRKMSIIGPRPHMINQTNSYRKIINKFMVRHFTKPGITGWAQINGFRGETKRIEDMKKRAEADIWYIENWSFILDMKIMIITMWNMIFKKDEKAC